MTTATATVRQDDTVARIDVSDLQPRDVEQAVVIHDGDPLASNTCEDPDRVVPRATARLTDAGVLELELPPTSWSAVSLRVSAR